MTKTFSKVLAVILSLCVLFAVPVCAGAEGDTFAINGASFKAVTYDWKDDYIGRLKVTVTGGIASLVSEDILIKVTANDSAEPFKVIAVTGTELYIGNGNAEMTFYLEYNLIHGDTYTFTIPAGTFASADGKLNEEFSVTVTGNDLLETIDADDVPVTPIEKIVEWLKAYVNDETWGWLAQTVINILNWFITI